MKFASLAVSEVFRVLPLLVIEFPAGELLLYLVGCIEAEEVALRSFLAGEKHSKVVAQFPFSSRALPTE